MTSTGRTFVVTDNDGVDDWSGESWFFDLGALGGCSVKGACSRSKAAPVLLHGCHISDMSS